MLRSLLMAASLAISPASAWAEAPDQAKVVQLAMSEEKLARSEEPADEFASLEVVSNAELDTQRGGFVWDGVEIGLGAEIRTFLNGELVLQTNVSWTAAGAQVTQTMSGALTPAAATQLQSGILNSGGITMRVGDQQVFLANAGQTAILHRTDGAIQNILINTASSVDARQEVDAVLDLGNFGQFQDHFLGARLTESIGETVGQATIGGLGN